MLIAEQLLDLFYHDNNKVQLECEIYSIFLLKYSNEYLYELSGTHSVSWPWWWWMGSVSLHGSERWGGGWDGACQAPGNGVFVRRSMSRQLFQGRGLVLCM